MRLMPTLDARPERHVHDGEVLELIRAAVAERASMTQLQKFGLLAA